MVIFFNSHSTPFHHSTNPFSEEPASNQKFNTFRSPTKSMSLEASCLPDFKCVNNVPIMSGDRPGGAVRRGFRVWVKR